MKFARLRTRDGIKPVIVSGEEAYDLTEFLGDITPNTMDLLEPAAVAAANGKLNRVSLTDAEFAAPIVHTGAVIAIGMNYAAHAAESGSAPPTLPVMKRRPSRHSTGWPSPRTRTLRAPERWRSRSTTLATRVPAARSASPRRST